MLVPIQFTLCSKIELKNYRAKWEHYKTGVQTLQHDIQRLDHSIGDISSTPAVIEIESKIINESSDLRDSLKTINEIAIELHEANQLTHKLIPTATPVPTYTPYPTYTVYPTLAPLPTYTPFPPPTPDFEPTIEESNYVPPTPTSSCACSVQAVVQASR